MESWKSVAIWALCWRHDRPHHQRRIQLPVNCFRQSSEGDGMDEAYSDQKCRICESLCHECSEDCPDSYLVLWGNHQDWPSPEKLGPSTCLRIRGKRIMWMIVFIADILHQAVAMIIGSHAAMVFGCKASINSMDGFWTTSPTEICEMVAWLLAKDRFTRPTNVHEVSSKFPSCLIVVLMINLGVQVPICSNWNCGSYSPLILLRHMTNGNERLLDG